MQQVILAAGKGSRLKSSITNKCLVDLCGTKLIDHSLNLGVEIKASKIIVIVGHNKEYIINYLANSYKGIPIEYVVQEPQKGIAHGIMVASQHITEAFLMCLSDEIMIAPNMQGFKEYFASNNADCVCGIVKDSAANIKKAYTLELTRNNKITHVLEKPKIVFNSFKGTGYCMMNRRMLDILKDLTINPIRNEYEMGDWIELAIRNKYNCYAYEIAEAAYNINEEIDLKKAKEHMLSRGVENK